MAEVIRMPKMSDTMTEGVIVSWLKKVGDDVKPGDILAEVETDKATMELENYVKGTLLHIGIEEGGSVPVDAVIAVVGKKGEDVSALIGGGSQPAAGNDQAEEKGKETEEKEVQSGEPAQPKARKTGDGEEQDEKPAEPAGEKESKEKEAAPRKEKAADTTGDSRLKASPLAKKIADDKGIDISQVSGSGDNGRIVKRDVESYTPAPAAKAPAAAAGAESYQDLPLSQMRKAIARRLSESKFSAPHFYLTMSINMDKAMEARKAMLDYSEVKISVNDLIIKAVAASLRKHPAVNASWLGDKIRQNNHINIGVAVAIEDGLIVPVVKFADTKSISQISAEVKDLAGRAKTKKLQPAEFEGNTFTISNLGMFGIEEFTAIINPPDSCILAIGAAQETAIVENGQIKAAHIMKVTMSCDHRSVDGAVGAAFLQTLKELLENPVKILV